jgi:hypothetical protein
MKVDTEYKHQLIQLPANVDSSDIWMAANFNSFDIQNKLKLLDRTDIFSFT